MRREALRIYAAGVRRVSVRLKDKAISSIRRMVGAFNGIDDDGRQTAVLLYLQHAFEMLLKAGLRERGVDVFDKTTGRSIGFECVRLAREHLGLTEEQLGVMRAVDNLRDDEQHWLAQVSEGLLYLHARAGVTLIDEILASVFKEPLATHLDFRYLMLNGMRVDPRGRGPVRTTSTSTTTSGTSE